MNAVSHSRKRATLRALAGAAVSACLVATIGLVSSSAAEPAKPAAPMDEGAAMHGMRGMHEAMGQRWAQHVQAHLDKLAERMEIKASQEAAWQKFSSAFHNNMSMHPMMGHPPGHEGEHEAPATDAAALARQQADRAWDHAQKLTQLADATAALQQVLTPEQRLVFDEAARHFAHEHGEHGSMGMMAGGYHGAMEGHCESDPHGGGHGEYVHPHGYGHGAYQNPHGHGDADDDNDDEEDDPHPGMMESPHDGHGAPGAAAH